MKTKIETNSQVTTGAYRNLLGSSPTPKSKISQDPLCIVSALLPEKQLVFVGEDYKASSYIGYIRDFGSALSRLGLLIPAYFKGTCREVIQGSNYNFKTDITQGSVEYVVYKPSRRFSIDRQAHAVALLAATWPLVIVVRVGTWSNKSSVSFSDTQEKVMGGRY